MKKSSLSQLLAAICLSASVLFAADPAPTPVAPDFDAMRAEVEALGDLNEPPKYEVLERPDATPNLKPIFYSGLDYQGKPTTVLPGSAFQKIPMAKKCLRSFSRTAAAARLRRNG